MTIRSFVRRRPRGLWLSREHPFPLDTGDRIYSAQLIRALAEAGCSLTVAGFAPSEGVAAPSDWPVSWRTVAGARRGQLAALCSRMPLVAAVHATPAYRALVERLACEQWDFVVVDQYGMGWALPAFQRRRRAGEPGPVLVHVAHDHEASVYASLVHGFSGSALRRLGLWQNWRKTVAFERGIARSVDLVTAITGHDAVRFREDAPSTPNVVLTPGYAGPVLAQRVVDATVPRQVVMVGNYRWVAKAENLRQFVRAADAVFAQHGITLHVIGSMSEELAAELRTGAQATVLHGFVEDIAPHLAQARLAVVPEEIGGGFKLKYLDYLFGRVPVATLAHATAGLPPAIRNAMLCRPTVAALVQGIVDAMDDTARLDAMQRQAFGAAASHYRWQDRGDALLHAITRQRRAVQHAAPRRRALGSLEESAG